MVDANCRSGTLWRCLVRSRGGYRAQLFTRGREAENAAKGIAERLAAAGDQVELHLSLRNGQLAGRFVCLPPISDDDGPLLVGGSLLARAALKRSADVPA